VFSNSDAANIHVKTSRPSLVQHVRRVYTEIPVLYNTYC